MQRDGSHDTDVGYCRSTEEKARRLKKKKQKAGESYREVAFAWDLEGWVKVPSAGEHGKQHLKPNEEFIQLFRSM